MLDEPAVVLLAAAAAAVCLLLEAALPTAGLAGTAGLALAALALWGAGSQGEAWWPLLGVVAAVTLWGVAIVARRDGPGLRVSAAALFLAGGLGYALSTGDAPTAIAALVSTALLALVAHPRIVAGAERLHGAPAQVGMESFVGSTAEVSTWSVDSGTVVLAGSLWSAVGPGDLRPGERVVVTASSGLLLRVDRLRSAP